MKENRKISSIILESLAYGLFGTSFVVLLIVIEEYIESFEKHSGFIVHTYEETLALIPLFFGLFISVILGNLLLKNEIKLFKICKWIFILLFSCFSAVSLQKIMLIYFQNQTFSDTIVELFSYQQNSLGLWWMLKLLIFLTPFTAIFASRHFLFDKLKNRNSLR